jgi:hypothetical protein
MRRVMLLASFSLMLGACAELNSIHRTRPIPAGNEGRVVTVDAKQRHLLVLPDSDSTTNTKWRVCAEAAPDVFSAYAASGGARGDKSGGEVSFASAETAATIERTQTINLLRESFYRTCERYASGAINRTQFIIQAARDQRSMVAVLAIEQLTGAVRPKSTIISGPGTAASTLSGADAAELIEDYNKRLKTAEAAQAAAQTALDEAGKKDGVCADGEKKDEAACAALKSKLDSAKKDVTTALTGLDNAMKLVKDLVSASTASTTTGTNTAGGGISQDDISESNLAHVANAVVAINEASFINEPLMFCIGYLSGLKNVVLTDPITQTCLSMLVAKQNADQIATNGQTLDYANAFVGRAYATAALAPQITLMDQIAGIWKCGDPASDNATFLRIIADAKSKLSDSSWDEYIGSAKTKEEAVEYLTRSRAAVMKQFLASQTAICGGS